MLYTYYLHQFKTYYVSIVSLFLISIKNKMIKNVNNDLSTHTILCINNCVRLYSLYKYFLEKASIYIFRFAVKVILK